MHNMALASDASQPTTQPKSSPIPVIDIAGPKPETAIAAELVDAAVAHGFVFIKNQGKDIPVSVIDGIFDVVSFQ